MFCFLWMITGLQAQSALGVVWDPPSNDIQASNEIAFFREHTAELIIMNYPQRDYVLAELTRQGVPYIMDTSLEFVTTSLLDAGSQTLRQQIEDIYRTEHRFEAFEGILLFSHSQSYDKRFVNILTELVVSIGLEDSIRFVERFRSQLRRLDNQSVLGTFFEPKRADVLSLKAFKQAISGTGGFLIVDHEWLKEAINQYPAFGTALKEAESLHQAVIPLPEIPAETPVFHWSVLVLLLLWVSLAININLNPTYKETIPRYFTAHRFFVDDILSYRERSSISAVFLLFQHAVFGGLVTYILAKTFISEEGLQALYYYAPQIAVAGSNYFSLFMVGTILVFIVELIAAFWIYIPNPSLSHFNQVLNMFTWIFHVDFIIVSLMVVLFFAGASAITLTAFAVLYMLFWFASFSITALDSSKRLGVLRTGYLLKTIFLHSLLATLVITLLAIFNDWVEVLDLVFHV